MDSPQGRHRPSIATASGGDSFFKLIRDMRNPDPRTTTVATMAALSAFAERLERLLSKNFE